MNKKVSIIIPVYNGSNYVKEAIDSALAQTYKNIEIIVVNDGSKDDGKTKEICTSYGDKIRYFEKENGGVSTALNYGISKMEGEYFSWLSHDDLYYPNKIELQIKEMESSPKNTILYSNYDLINSDGIKYEEVDLDHDLLTKKPDYALLRNGISGITLLIPKQAFTDCGLFDENLRCVQDYELWFKMLEKYNFKHMREHLALGRVHQSQVTFTSPKVLSEGNPFWIKIAKEYPKSKKIEYEGSEYSFYKEMANNLSTTVYKEAAEKIDSFANEILESERKKKLDEPVTVIVLAKDEESLEKTIASIEKQTYKNVEIIIEGATKLTKYPTTKNREETLHTIKTKYFSFVTSGVIAESNWLEELLLISKSTNLSVIIPNYSKERVETLINNYTTILTPLDGILLKTETPYKKECSNYFLYLYAIAKEGGVIALCDQYLSNISINYDMKDIYALLEELLKNKELTDYQVASFCYDIACTFNRYAKTATRIYMYEPCDRLKELSYSRSFQLLTKYIDHKKKKKNK